MTVQPLSRLAALPPHVSEIVLLFAIGEHFLSPSLRSLAPFQAFAHVCKDWFALLDEAVSRRALAYFSHDFTKPTRSLVLEDRRQLILRRAYLKKLMVDRAPDYGDLTEQMWHVTLSHAPHLEALDLDSVEKYCLPAHRLADVLKAASWQCPHLQWLGVSPTVPVAKRHERDRFPIKNRMDVFTNALYVAMQRWSKFEGLRLLNISTTDYYTASFTRGNRFLKAITEYCPRITYPGGSGRPEVNSRDSEQWWVSVDTWEAFCRECKHLEDLKWMAVPFATAYFDIFGCHRHERLERLKFVTPAHWHWTRFLEEADSVTRHAVEDRGYGGRAVKPQAALRACPNLKRLTIEWLAKRQNRDHDLAKLAMDAEVFGDDFFEAAATHCKLLESANSTCASPTQTQSLLTLTDRSLRALAQLPHLTELKLEGPNVTGDGVFDFVMNHAAETTATRQYDFALGDTTSAPTSTLFYDVVKRFMQRVVDQVPGRTRRVVVVFTNRKKETVDSAWSTDYFRELRAMGAAARVKFPSVTCRGVVTRYKTTDKSFTTMSEYVFATTEYTRRPKNGEMEIDEAFANQPYPSMGGNDPFYISEDDDDEFDDDSDGDSDGDSEDNSDEDEDEEHEEFDY